VFAKTLIGGSPRALTTMSIAHSLAWSPDGRWIAAASDNAEFVYWSLGNTGPRALSSS